MFCFSYSGSITFATDTVQGLFKPAVLEWADRQACWTSTIRGKTATVLDATLHSENTNITTAINKLCVEPLQEIKRDLVLFDMKS